MDKEKIINDYFENPKTGLKSFSRIYDDLKNQGITLKEIETVLNKNQMYQLHKQPKYIYDKILVKEPNKYYQVDLVDMTNYSRNNNKFGWILNLIDIFSKKAYSIACKNKTHMEIKEKLKEIIDKNNLSPKQIISDNGGEFINKNMAEYLKGKKIYHNTIEPNSPNSNGIVERFNRTLKQMIFKYFTLNNTLKWVDVLDDLIDNYNNSINSSVGKKPNQINEKNKYSVIEYIENKTFTPSITNEKYLNVGDKVRILLNTKQFDKKTGVRFTDKLYKIVARIRGIYGLQHDKYVLENPKGEQERKLYYYNDLIKVDDNKLLDISDKKNYDSKMNRAKKMASINELGGDKEIHFDNIEKVRKENEPILDVQNKRLQIYDNERIKKDIDRYGYSSGAGIVGNQIILRKAKDGIHKYYVIINNKKVYFGAKGYSDFILSDGDKLKKKNYLARHSKNEDWSINGIEKAGFWSRYILWNKTTIKSSIKDIEKKFGVKIKNET
jgi:hypothetical protein